MAKDHYKPIIDALAKHSALYPQEAPMMIKEQKGNLVIGIPKESELQENRTSLTPESVGILISSGHQVLLESGAGLASKFTDQQYSEKGAQISSSSKEVFESNIILKVEPPTLEEIDYMKPKSCLISAVQMAGLKEEYLTALNKKKITSVGFEFIEDKGGLKPVVRSMSEIASNCIVTIAGELLGNSGNGMGVIFGGVTGVPPIKLIILGAGTVGENVARAARHLGADVKIFDNHVYKLRRIKKEVGEELYTSMIDNYTLSRELEQADVVVGALRSEEGSSLCVVTEEMVSKMRPDSVIIDVSISQGGCFATSRTTTHKNPTYRMYDVIHYCVPNIASRASRTATKSLSYIFTPMILQIGKACGVDGMMAEKDWFRSGVYTYNGHLTNEAIGMKLNLAWKDLDLLFAARF